MRLLSLSSILILLACNGSTTFVYAADSELYPPGLLPLINRANILLSTGQFNEAAKVYSEAIDQSPTDYLLYYKRATAYLSLQRHNSAQDDFDKVLSLTLNTFDNAHLMKARIYTRDGHFESARTSLSSYIKAKGKKKMDKEAEELDAEIKHGERLKEKSDKERKAQLWNACIETTSEALRVASHSVEIRTWRAECALAAGDVESSVGDLTRLSHLLPPSTQLLTHIFRLSYFLLQPSPASMNTLKQCLHYDPDSKICLRLHRMVRSLDKGFTKLEELLGKEDWRAVVKLLMTPGPGKNNGDVWRRWEEAMLENVGNEKGILPLVPVHLIQATIPHPSPPPPSSSSSSPTTSTSTTTPPPPSNSKKPKEPPIPLPLASKVSPQRQILVRALCKSYTHLSDNSRSTEYKAQMERWCEELLTLEGCKEDIDGLVGRGEALLGKEEWEDAVRSLEKAFENSGRGDREILQRVQNAKKLLKQSKQKDYYKIIGVSRDADPKTIKKAFRKAAKIAHPDKGGSEAKMAVLNEAYEVLSNPELKQRFDNGEDPMDPMAGQGGSPFAAGEHPFAQFFQASGGGGGRRSGFAGNQGGFQFHFSHGH